MLRGKRWMAYSIEIIRKNQQQVSKWSGGTTTQLLIYPPEAIYSERNFKWRISSAKVEIDESIFTSLPGISRIIMILDGTLKLEHEGHHSIILNKFDQDNFSGDWVTKSYGKVTDFNLMMSRECVGKINLLTINGEGQKKHLVYHNDMNYSNITEAFYFIDGDVDVLVDGQEKLKLFQGDLLYISYEKCEEEHCLEFFNHNSIKCNIINPVINY